MEPKHPHDDAGKTAGKRLSNALGGRLRGELRADALARTLYSTDASIYEIVPDAVVWPRDIEDVVATVNACRMLGIPIVARGAGTGLAGGAVGGGVQLDLSRHMNSIVGVDVEAQTVEVAPGVVLDELNAQLAKDDLQFAPDVATSSRATIGGMIANNSCGAHSIVYGRTVDHVLELTVVLPDGNVVTFPSGACATTDSKNAANGRAPAIQSAIAQVRNRYHDEIVRRFPKVLRSNGGYGLDRLGAPGSNVDIVKLLCGSEGTLAIIVGAKLRVVPRPKSTGLIVLQFHDLLDGLAVTPALLTHKPAAVELMDRMILEASKSNPAMYGRCNMLENAAAALILVEVFGDDEKDVRGKLDAILQDKDAVGSSFVATACIDASDQAAVWDLRKAGLGLLMSRPGDEQPYAFVEDSAVDPSKLRDYIERFGEILSREGVTAGYYAHASVGCIHVRPVLNLKSGSDVERMRRIAESVADLALEFGGAMTGEHGDGIVRSCWAEKMYGPKIVEAFREVKDIFDPHHLFNPHKIVDAYDMTDHLRYGPSFKTASPKTTLSFAAHDGMAGLAGMCSGVGQCRQRLVGTMCPSYMATGDEMHTTRARANALRVALSNRGLLNGLDDPHLEEVMDLCLQCKACKTECPTGVDMAKLKVEYLSHKNLRDGVSRQARFVAEMPCRAQAGSRFPRLTNLIAQSSLARAWIERRYGLDRRMPPPRWARRTFRSWFRHHRRRLATKRGTRGRVIYFVDTWMNHFAPQVGIATVTLLDRAGFNVVCPDTVCCGRPAISKGLLSEAKLLAETNVERLGPLLRGDDYFVGTEPSCILTFKEEYPQLLQSTNADKLALRAEMIESFLARLLERSPDALTFRQPDRLMLYHAHCHQKALVGTSDAVNLLRRAIGSGVREINSGCCGMAGSFGHEKEHYDVAKAVGEQRLFPAIRNQPDALVAVSGFSCREQIGHHTSSAPRHVVEYLADVNA